MKYSLVEEFGRQMRHDYANTTLVNYMSDINQFLCFVGDYFGNDNGSVISLIDWEVCNEYKNSLVDKGLKETSINRKIESVRTFFDFCIRKKIILDNPMKDVNRMSTKHIEQVTEFLTLDEMKKLLHAIQTKGHGDRCFNFISARDTLLYTLILTVGLRIQEATSVKFEDLSIEKMTLKTVGKGKKFRELPIDNNVVQLYYKYLEEREKIAVKNDCEEFLFISNRGGRVSTQSSNQALKKYCERACIRDISNHVLRHTCATHLASRNTPLSTISELLGHGNVATTSKYVHSSLDLMRQAIGYEL